MSINESCKFPGQIYSLLFCFRTKAWQRAPPHIVIILVLKNTPKSQVLILVFVLYKCFLFHVGIVHGEVQWTIVVVSACHIQ